MAAAEVPSAATSDAVEAQRSDRRRGPCRAEERHGRLTDFGLTTRRPASHTFESGSASESIACDSAFVSAFVRSVYATYVVSPVWYGWSAA